MQIDIPCAFVCVGLIRPGGTVVEGTAGNTGIGLAHLCNSLSYKCVIFMPNTQSMVSRARVEAKLGIAVVNWRFAFHYLPYKGRPGT